MQEHYVTIGEVAGKIYRTLEKSGPVLITNLQKEIQGVDAAVLNQALGWLAREGKIDFQKKGKSFQLLLLAVNQACCA